MKLLVEICLRDIKVYFNLEYGSLIDRPPWNVSREQHCDAPFEIVLRAIDGATVRVVELWCPRWYGTVVLLSNGIGFVFDFWACVPLIHQIWVWSVA